MHWCPIVVDTDLKPKSSDKATGRKASEITIPYARHASTPSPTDRVALTFVLLALPEALMAGRFKTIT